MSPWQDHFLLHVLGTLRQATHQGSNAQSMVAERSYTAMFGAAGAYASSVYNRTHALLHANLSAVSAIAALMCVRHEASPKL